MRLVLLIGTASGALFLAAQAAADVNPWVAANVWNPEKWDTAGPETGTPWLHPPTWTPGQGWGLFNGHWRTADALTGSWGGVRDRLVERGFSVAAAYLGQLASNPVGGADQGTSWKSDFGLSMFLDLNRLVGWKGGFFVSSFDYKTPGRTLSSDYIDNQFPVQLDSFDDDGAARLVHLAIGQQLFDNTAELVAGRLIAGEDFASIRFACTSLNQAICGNPINAVQNISFSTFPSAQWGARFKVKPGSGWYAQAGAYLAFEDFRDPDFHGVKFSAPDGSGPLALAEFGYIVGHYRQRPGLPGKYKVGGYYDGERLTELDSGDAVRGTWGLYGLAEQMLFAEDAQYSQGLTAWGALSFAPPDRNQLEMMAVAGLAYQGLISTRDRDGLAFIASYGYFSRDLGTGQDFELMLELNYRISIAPWVYVQPDVQGIIHPDGVAGVPDAFVIGCAVGFVL